MRMQMRGFGRWVRKGLKSLMLSQNAGMGNRAGLPHASLGFNR